MIFLKNALEIIAYVVGPLFLLLGLASLILFCIISFNDKMFQLLEIGGSLAVIILGWTITMFANKTKRMSLLQIILDLFFSI